MPRTPKALISFDGYSDPNLETKANLIVSSLNGNASFPNPTPDIPTVQAMAQQFTNALNAAIDGSASDIALKNQTRAQLIALLRKLGGSVTVIADGDRAVLLTSGFDVSKNGTTPSVVTKPQNPQLTNGNNSGELIMSVDAASGAKAYLFEISTDAALSEAAWQKFTSTQSRYTFTGLVPGTKYYCRVAVVGSKNQFIYSDVISRIVV